MDPGNSSQSYRCRFCRGTFSKAAVLQEHVRKIHTPDGSAKTNRFCAVCKLLSPTRESYRDHVKHIHGQTSEGQTILFRSFKDFVSWKSELEKRFGSRYFQKQVPLSLPNHEKVYVYSCDGGDRGKRRPEASVPCHSALIAFESSRSKLATVEYWSAHRGHMVPCEEDELDSAISSIETAEMLLMQVQNSESMFTPESPDAELILKSLGDCSESVSPIDSTASPVTSKPISAPKKVPKFSLASVACGKVTPPKPPPKKVVVENTPELPAPIFQDSENFVKIAPRKGKSSDATPTICLEDSNSSTSVTASNAATAKKSAALSTNAAKTSTSLPTNLAPGQYFILPQSPAGATHTSSAISKTPSNPLGGNNFIILPQTVATTPNKPVPSNVMTSNSGQFVLQNLLSNVVTSPVQNASIASAVNSSLGGQQFVIIPQAGSSPLRLPNMNTLNANQVVMVPQRSVLRGSAPTTNTITNPTVVLSNNSSQAGPQYFVLNSDPNDSQNVVLCPIEKISEDSTDIKGKKRGAGADGTNSIAKKPRTASQAQEKAMSSFGMALSAGSGTPQRAGAVPQQLVVGNSQGPLSIVTVAGGVAEPISSRVLANIPDGTSFVNINNTLVPIKNAATPPLSNFVMPSSPGARPPLFSSGGRNTPRRAGPRFSAPNVTSSIQVQKVLLPTAGAPAAASLPPPLKGKKPGSIYFESDGDFFILEPLDEDAAMRLMRDSQKVVAVQHPIDKAGEKTLDTPPNEAEDGTVSALSPLKKHNCDGQKGGEGSRRTRVQLSHEDADVAKKVKFYQLEMKFLAVQEECKRLKLQLAKQKLHELDLEEKREEQMNLERLKTTSGGEFSADDRQSEEEADEAGLLHSVMRKMEEVLRTVAGENEAIEGEGNGIPIAESQTEIDEISEVEFDFPNIFEENIRTECLEKQTPTEIENQLTDAHVEPVEEEEVRLQHLEKETQTQVENQSAEIQVNLNIIEEEKVSLPVEKQTQTEVENRSTETQVNLNEGESGFVRVRATYVESLKGEIQGLGDENRFLFQELESYRSNHEYADLSGMPDGLMELQLAESSQGNNGEIIQDGSC